MTSKQKHSIIGFFVIVACSALVVPMFFQTKEEFNPWVWIMSSRIPHTPVVVEPPNPQLQPLPAVQKTSTFTAKAWVVTLKTESIDNTPAWVATLQQQGFPAFINPKNPKQILLGPELSSTDADLLMKRLPPELRVKTKITPFDPGF